MRPVLLYFGDGALRGEASDWVFLDGEDAGPSKPLKRITTGIGELALAVRVRREIRDEPTYFLLGGISIFGGRGTIAGVVIAVAVLGCLQTALTADLIPAQDQNIVVGVLLVASVIVPNSADLYRRARERWRSAAARRQVAAAAQSETR